MNLLLIPPAYPYPAAPYNGAQNERCAQALSQLVNRVVVVCPRPFVPSSIAFRPRWKLYASIPPYSVVGGIEVYRPACPVIPGLMQAVWQNEAAYYVVRPLVRKLQQKYRFDAILSFDLLGAGGLAWRLGRDLDIPAAGWATGGDIRCQPDSSFGRKVIQTVIKLNVVFYQSSELLHVAADLLKSTPEALKSSGRHAVLSRGIIAPRLLPAEKMRREVRARLGITEDQVMILYVGRVVYEKGLFGLIDVFAKNVVDIKLVKLVIVGSQPSFDHSAEFAQHVLRYPALVEHLQVLPACSPEETWSYQSAADIFVFPSFMEGMPNSLLEAMICGLPSITFDIPAIRDLLRYDQQALCAVQSFDFAELLEKLLLLARSANLRKDIGSRARQLVHRHFSLIENMKRALEYLSASCELVNVRN